MGQLAPLLAAAFVGYLLGSIPFGLLLTRAAGLGDVRKIGSGNIGATNVLRTGNKGLAAATLLLDALKATVAVLLVWWLVARWYGGAATGAPAAFMFALPVAAGLGAFLGHIFPVWLNFKGGKGIATLIGALLGLHWPLAAVFCAVWLVVAFALRLSSLAAIVATIVVLAVVHLGAHLIAVPPSMLPALKPAMAAMTLLVLITHRANIRRLLAGEEPRIGQKT
jgi:glycerol-3-phosphate acyltransferase PlsY